MKKKHLTILSFVFLAVLLTTFIAAQQVGSQGLNTPKQIVEARKFVMQTIAANAGDLRGKIKAGNIKGVAANAQSIAALATLAPPLFQEAHSSVYPVGKSKYYFKQGQVNIPAAFGGLKEAALGLMKSAAAGDRAGVNSGVKALFGACGMCHQAARGKN